MAITRKQALRRLEGLAGAANRHLEIHIPSLLDEHPEDLAHWRAELRSWIEEMRRLTTKVGKRTAEQWNERIADIESRAAALLGTD